MLHIILKILMIGFGVICGCLFTLPMFIFVLEDTKAYVLFGIGCAIGVVAALGLAYMLVLYVDRV